MSVLDSSVGWIQTSDLLIASPTSFPIHCQAAQALPVCTVEKKTFILEKKLTSHSLLGWGLFTPPPHWQWYSRVQVPASENWQKKILYKLVNWAQRVCCWQGNTEASSFRCIGVHQKRFSILSDSVVATIGDLQTAEFCLVGSRSCAETDTSASFIEQFPNLFVHENRRYRW